MMRLAIVLLLLLPVLAACGKKAPIRAPDGREAEFTYPRIYPDPKSVVPQAGTTGPFVETESSTPDELSISPIPKGRETTTTIYSSE